MASGLGESFKATILLGGVSQNAMVPNCFSAKIETPRGALLTNPRIEFDRFDGNRNTVLIKLGSAVLITEPAVTLTLELLCDGSMRRTYPLLLDVPELGRHHKAVIAALGVTSSVLPDAPAQRAEVRNAAYRSDTEAAHGMTLRYTQAADLTRQEPAQSNMTPTIAPTIAPTTAPTSTLPMLWIILLSMVILVLCGAIIAVLVILRRTRPTEPPPRSGAAPARSEPVSQPAVQRSPKPAAVAPIAPVTISPTMPSPAEAAVTLPVQEQAPKLPAQAFNLFANRDSQSIHIEEISDAVQEAEFWLALKDPGRAIEILEPQCIGDDPSTPVMWLLLLDLYRTVKDQEKYAQLRQRFKGKFNTNILELDETSAPGTVKYLCDFEHLTGKLAAFWNTSYILPFLESLLIDDREGERVGFELSVYQDILMLIAVAKELIKPAEGSSQT